MTLVAFDFDGTLSTDEMIIELGEQVGRAEEIADVTERAMKGELSYAESLRGRVTMLGTPSIGETVAAYEQVSLRPGMAALLEDLMEAGVRTVILTGGFESGVQYVLEREGVIVDRVIANRLVRTETRLTGEVEGPLVDGSKDQELEQVAREFGIPLAETIAIGDGANDVPMLTVAGTAIGFQPKQAVRQYCDIVVTSVQQLRSVFEEQGLVISATPQDEQ